MSGLLLASLMSITLIPEAVSRSARAAGGRGQRIGVPAAIRRPFLVASVAVIASFGALGLVAALGPRFVASLLHVDNRAVGGAVVFAMLSASAIAQLAARAWIARRQLIAGATSLAFGLLTLVGGVATRSLATFVLGVLIAGVGQGLAYLGARKALLDNVAPADRRGALKSAFFLVLYIAAAVAALAVGVSRGPLGLRTATIIVATCLTSRMSFSGCSRSS